MSELGSVSPSARRRAKAKPYANGKPDPSQELLQALQAMRSGDFSVRMTGDHLGTARTIGRQAGLLRGDFGAGERGGVSPPVLPSRGGRHHPGLLPEASGFPRKEAPAG